MNMKRILKVGEASSKIVWAPGSRQVPETATAEIRGSLAAATVEKNEPKLVPLMPMRLVSISGRAARKSTQALPVAAQFATEK